MDEPTQQYRVYLNELMIIRPRATDAPYWPWTVIGDGVKVAANSAERAIHEVSDEKGVNAAILTAELVKG
jgi:hypothetical protein